MPSQSGSEDKVLTNSIQTAQLHSDALGEWVVIDDGPDYASALLLPVLWAHRQVVERGEVAARFAAVENTAAELASMRRAIEALEALEGTARTRAVRWLVDRLGVNVMFDPDPRAVPSKADSESRKRWLQEQWVAGVPIETLAEQLGIKLTSLPSLVSRMRREGWAMPHRKRGRAPS